MVYVWYMQNLGCMNVTVVYCCPFVDLLEVEGLTEAENIDPSALYNDVRIHVHVLNFVYCIYNNMKSSSLQL